MPSRLQAFLARNSVAAAEGLPLVHTTASANMRDLMGTGVIRPQPCDVFTKDSLNYFFVGRPAYKYESDSSQTPHWELPCCFIFEADAIATSKRTFPFDSGAFHKKLYPSYMHKLKMAEFESGEIGSARKLIGAFFGNAKRYMEMKPKSREDFETEYSIGPLEAELSAVSLLANESTITRFDDRRFTIEVQTDEEVQLTHTNPIAVIVPDVYLDDTEVRDAIEIIWKAEAIGYPMHSLSLANYYGIIYGEVKKLYERRGFL